MADEIDKQLGQTEPVQPDPAPDKSGGNKSTDGKGGNGGDETNPAWLPGRLADARKAAENKLLKDLGFEKSSDLAAYVAQKREADRAQMTETERLRTELEASRAEAALARQTAESEHSARQTEKVENAIRAAAATARAEIPADVVTLLRTEGKLDLTKLLSEDGNVQADAITALIADAKKIRPSWFGRTGVGSPSNAGGAPPEPNAKTREETRAQLMRNMKNKF